MSTVDVHLVNNSGRLLFVNGHAGTDWTYVSQNGVRPGGSDKIGTFKLPGVGDNDQRGWIYLAETKGRNELQAFIATGSSRGVFDYCLQYYDDGKNTNGTTINGTQAELRKGNVWLTVGPDLFHSWTNRLPDSTLLHQISLPGTHDSCTHSLSGNSRTQLYPVTEQLHMGVRYFDIRLDGDRAYLPVIHGAGHGFADTGYTLVSVAHDFLDFLSGKVDPLAVDETVVVQVKFDHGYKAGKSDADVLNILSLVFQGSGRLHNLPITPANPTPIGDLRGKLVLMRRYGTSVTDEPIQGTAVDRFVHEADYQAWKSGGGTPAWPFYFPKQAFDWPDYADDPAGLRNLDEYPVVLQDNYGLTMAPKWELVQKYLIAAASGRPDAWFLNFASSAALPDGPHNIATMVNRHLKQWFAARGRCRAGTILMDYVERDVVKAVIGSNF
ncbi:hypothetical protein [Sphingomonas sp.]|uniref:hypothetical protein n=1 Tax=Sphingomonas sp. TaxID=28214 RepID=UPI001B1AD001|nr:hypothetical protein [Sphingomonas sp.]MBO9715167.1 hypothetical protein [Sphingomonas sp.]